MLCGEASPDPHAILCFHLFAPRGRGSSLCQAYPYPGGCGKTPSNAAVGNAYNVADMASLLQAVRNAGANNVVIRGAWRARAASRSGWPW